MRKDVKPVITIEQNGTDFTFTIKTPHRTKSQSFSVGKESEVTGVDGRKIKVMRDHLIFGQVNICINVKMTWPKKFSLKNIII